MRKYITSLIVRRGLDIFVQPAQEQEQGYRFSQQRQHQQQGAQTTRHLHRGPSRHPGDHNLFRRRGRIACHPLKTEPPATTHATDADVSKGNKKHTKIPKAATTNGYKEHPQHRIRPQQTYSVVQVRPIKFQAQNEKEELTQYWGCSNCQASGRRDRDRENC